MPKLDSGSAGRYYRLVRFNATYTRAQVRQRVLDGHSVTWAENLPPHVGAEADVRLRVFATVGRISILIIIVGLIVGTLHNGGRASH